MDPITATPLSETLHTVVSYFRQVAEPYGHTTDTTGYARGTLALDPYYYDFTDPLMTDTYVPCAKTFVLLPDRRRIHL